MPALGHVAQGETGQKASPEGEVRAAGSDRDMPSELGQPTLKA